MNTTETETVKEILNNTKKGNEIGRKLFVDHGSGKIRMGSVLDDPDKVTEIDPEDMRLSSIKPQNSGRIVISADVMEKLAVNMSSRDVHFECWDEGDVYNLFHDAPSPWAVQGTIHFTDGSGEVSVSRIGKAEDVVRVIVRRRNWKSDNRSLLNPEFSTVTGHVFKKRGWRKVPIEIVPMKTNLFSRLGGLLETDILSKKKSSWLA